jgi:hypothetical protein
VYVRVALSDTLRYAVSAGGTRILGASLLGITTESADFTGDLTHESTERRSIRESYETVHGKRTDPISVDVPEHGGFTIHLHDPVETSPTTTPGPTESTVEDSRTEPTETSSDGQRGFGVAATLTALVGGALTALGRSTRRD